MKRIHDWPIMEYLHGRYLHTFSPLRLDSFATTFLHQILFASSILRPFTARMQNKVWHISILYIHAFPFYNSNGATPAIELLKRFPILISILLRHRPWFPMNRRLVKIRDHSNFYFIVTPSTRRACHNFPTDFKQFRFTKVYKAV